MASNEDDEIVRCSLSDRSDHSSPVTGLVQPSHSVRGTDSSPVRSSGQNADPPGESFCFGEATFSRKRHRVEPQGNELSTQISTPSFARASPAPSFDSSQKNLDRLAYSLRKEFSESFSRQHRSLKDLSDSLGRQQRSLDDFVKKTDISFSSFSAAVSNFQQFMENSSKHSASLEAKLEALLSRSDAAASSAPSAPSAPAAPSTAPSAPSSAQDVPSSSNLHSDVPSDIPSEEPSSKFPDQIQVLVNKAFSGYKRLCIDAERSKDHLERLKNFSASGTLPKSLQVKPPRISVNDSEANSFLESKLNALQSDANKAFLLAYIEAVSKASANFDAKIKSCIDDFDSVLKGTCTALQHLPFMGVFSVSAEEWYKEGLNDFHNKCNLFLIDRSLKKAAKAQANASRESSRDASMAEADELPPDPTIAQLVNDKINQKLSSLSNKIDSLLNNGKPQKKKSKKSSGSAQKGSAQKGPAQKGSAQKSPAQKNPAQKGPAQKGPARKNSAQKNSSASTDGVLPKNGVPAVGKNSTSTASGPLPSKARSYPHRRQKMNVQFAEHPESSSRGKNFSDFPQNTSILGRPPPFRQNNFRRTNILRGQDRGLGLGQDTA